MAQELVAASRIPPGSPAAAAATKASNTTNSSPGKNGAAAPTDAKEGRDASAPNRVAHSGHSGGIGGGDVSSSREPHGSSPKRESKVFGLSAEGGYLWVSHVRGARDEAVPYRVARDVPLSVLVGSDPMLARPLRLALHGLLMRLLVDQEFKRDFALAFARLYEVRAKECITAP